VWALSESALQQGETGLASIYAVVYVERTYPVLPALTVTVLPTLITLKFVHLKFQQKYEWIEHTTIEHHTKFEVEQKFMQKETKTSNPA